jgi:asparagine synthase (glutamine-hydrolysing)
MCGIAGMLESTGRDVDLEVLERMGARLEHRGPDAAGSWSDPRRRVGLVHRRLAIVDLSDAGLQPMGADDGRVQLVYNGEVYNHEELRGELRAAGHAFRGRSDTETLLAGYLQWGLDVLPRLVGMFAFAVWDGRSGELLLARDRIGVKPLYFRAADGRFAFASEIKALLADPRTPRETEPVAAWHYLSFVVPPAPLTMFRGIYKLPAGHLLRVRPGEAPRVERWWDPVDAPPPGLDPAVYADAEAAAAELLRRLDRSIERRMMADVPVGAFLSGGIDSTTNVALMARHTRRPVETFSVGFRRHERLNELEWARRVAEHYGTRHHEVLVDDDEMLGYLPEMVAQQDEPIADWVCVPLHFLSRLARASGVPVVQVGEGADEQLCGYEDFREQVRNHAHYTRPLSAMPGPLRRGAAGLARRLSQAGPVWARRAEIAAQVAAGHELFWGGAVAFRGERKRAVWAGPLEPVAGLPGFVPAALGRYESDGAVRSIVERFRAENPRADFYQSMLYLELRLRLPELLLMRVDKMTMASSVEARVPFLDHELVEFTMDLPLDLRVRGATGKYLLRRAVRGIVPDWVIERTKMGFAAPFREWFREEFGRWALGRLSGDRSGLLDLPYVRGMMLEHRAGDADHSFPLWVLLNLVLWHDHWIEGRAS